MGVKVNLLVSNPEGVRAGYLNFDTLAPQMDPHGRIQADFTKLDRHVDAGEVEDFIAHDVLDLFPIVQANDILDHWISRLAHGGTITISCVDLMEVSRNLVNRFITPEQANVLLHGEQDRPWKFRQGNYTLSQLVHSLAGKGLHVQMKRLDELKAIVVAQRL
jgi:hypothetical protein